MNVFFGEVPLCYTNSVAMTLSSYGYDFHPEYLEAIMAMGNGANFVNNDRAHPIVFFDNGEPDISISNCLRILGFEYEEFFLTAPDEVNVNMIKEKLKFYLKNGSIIAGPLDMGYLTYNPNHVNLKGIDHFVAIYDLVENDIYLHDPAGYPCMRMDLNEFLQAWKAENIYYKRGSFSMWGNLERTKIPVSTQIYHDVSVVMKKRYENGDASVIESYAISIRDNGLNQQQKQIHQYFSFRLAAARNIYMSRFLQEHDRKRAELKGRIAVLFGRAHLDSLKDDYMGLSNTLMSISELDKAFKELCIGYERK